MKQTIAQPSQLSQILQAARRQKKSTQSELAQVLDISQASYSRIERQTGRMTVAQLLAACKQLGLELTVSERKVSGATAPTAPAGKHSAW